MWVNSMNYGMSSSGSGPGAAVAARRGDGSRTSPRSRGGVCESQGELMGPLARTPEIRMIDDPLSRSWSTEACHSDTEKIRRGFNASTERALIS